MKNALVMNPEKCSGCHSREMICSLSLLQKYQKRIEKKSSLQELERRKTDFLVSVPLGAFW
jgi:Fe-S-cluster-containing hydrogenase component 2